MTDHRKTAVYIRLSAEDDNVDGRAKKESDSVTCLLYTSYLWKEDIEDGESVMTAEYRPVEYGKDYDVVNNPDKFQLYIDGKEVEE